jgi:hypothetical protein
LLIKRSYDLLITDFAPKVDNRTGFGLGPLPFPAVPLQGSSAGPTAAGCGFPATSIPKPPLARGFDSAAG